jgi:hypothetical protein
MDMVITAAAEAQVSIDLLRTPAFDKHCGVGRWIPRAFRSICHHIMVNFASELRPLGEGPAAAKFNIIGVGAYR